MANFPPGGGTCVVSCHYTKCKDMLQLSEGFGHSRCVCYDRGDAMMFAIEYGNSLEKLAKNAATRIVIVGDEGEEGKTQKDVEMPIMDKQGMKYEKMTLAAYKQRYEKKATAARTDGLTDVVDLKINGSNYTGTVKTGTKVKHGEGHEDSMCGGVGYNSGYKGTWKDGQYDGFGTLTMASSTHPPVNCGAVVKGQFKAGKFNDGTVAKRSGKTYEIINHKCSTCDLIWHICYCK